MQGPVFHLIPPHSLFLNVQVAFYLLEDEFYQFVNAVCILICIVLSQDAHNCIPEFDEETAMFAVYDGHGGNTHILSSI